MPRLRAAGIAVLCGALGLAAGVWLLRKGDAGPPRQATAPQAVAGALGEPSQIAPELAPLPLRERSIQQPDPTSPVPSPTAALCDDANWGELGLVVSSDPAGELRVDAPDWQRSLASTRVGIASWMSHCRSDSGAVRIIAADTGVLLATYDPASGLREPDS